METAESADGVCLPLPPEEMRRLVGPVDTSFFDNPSGDLALPGLPPAAFDSILDFGCGCGRVARKLLQQRVRPSRYLGIDLHRGMIDWCRANLAPHRNGFEFEHHDVFNLSLNPGADKPLWLPFPAADGDFSLVNAWSVFTHVNQDQASFYLGEVARVLRVDGLLLSTWFLFEKKFFPMMQPFQNALFINEIDSTNAVIFAREWLILLARSKGLKLVGAVPPTLRGYQWILTFAPETSVLTPVNMPEDSAPFGEMPPPLMPERAFEIGRLAKVEQADPGCLAR